MLPNFYIVGAAKAGTTSLYRYLSAHRDVFMCTPKEPNFFAHEEIDRQNLYYKAYAARSLREYESLFSGAHSKTAVGEASVSYLYYPSVAAKIHAMVPHARIIIVLRDPVERGWSHYLMDQRLGFVDALYSDIVHRASANRKLDLYHQQYIRLGFYHDQVARYFSVFGRDQIRVYLQDDLRADLHAVLSDVFQFLGITNEGYQLPDRDHNSFMAPRNSLIARAYASPLIRGALSRLLPDNIKDRVKRNAFDFEKKPNLPADLRAHLRESYRADIAKLETLIGRDLSKWH